MAEHFKMHWTEVLWLKDVLKMLCLCESDCEDLEPEFVRMKREAPETLEVDISLEIDDGGDAHRSINVKAFRAHPSDSMQMWHARVEQYDNMGTCTGVTEYTLRSEMELIQKQEFTTDGVYTDIPLNGGG